MASAAGLTLAGGEGAGGQKRLRILYHATQAFFTNGYENANLQDIAEAAGVGKVTIYRFFIDKADLFKNVLSDVTRHISEPLAGILDDDGSDGDGDPGETLVRFGTSYAQRLLEPIAAGHRYFELQRLILLVSRSHPEIGWMCRDIFRDNLHRPLVGYFSKLLERGVLADEEPDFLALTFIHMVFLTDIAIVEPSRLPSPASVEHEVRRFVRIFLEGTRRRAL